MFFEQIKVKGLGCFSYVLGCPGAQAMIVVDPKRDVQDYLDISRDRGMRITHIVDTHVHADHVSGAMELASRTGAEVCVFKDTPATYPFKPLAEGDVLQAGNARLKVLHTPGHTPHSISLLVSDLARSEEPWMILTGDLLFVGDIGRPDLAGAEVLEEQIRNLYDSLYNKLGALPDYLEVFPAHGAGSLCGKGMNPKPSSTLGYERAHNPGLGFNSFDDFHDAVGGDFPVRPKSFTHIISTNAKGAPLLDRCPIEKDLSVDAFQARMDAGAVVVDVRDGAAFGGFHIPGALNIGFEDQLANWMGMVVDPQADILLVAHDRDQYQAMRTELSRIGYDNVIGHLAGGMSAWIFAGRPVHRLTQVSVRELEERMRKGDAPLLLDVRTDPEWKGGRLAGASHMPFTDILADCCTLPTDDEVVVYCGTGYRSNMAGSYMQAHGYPKVSALAGGLIAWTRAGFALQQN